jgi:hypothetical protein
MNNSYLIAAGAGLVSAVCVVSVALGGPLGILLYLLVPLPLLLAGLALSWQAALAAGATASLLLLLLGGPGLAGMYAAAFAFPAALLSYMALLGRPGDAGNMEWYPPGRLVLAAALMGSAISSAAMLAIGGSREAIKDAVAPQMETAIKAQLEALGSPPPTAEELVQLSDALVSLLPGAAALLAMGLILLNLWLAGRVTRASGQLARPWPDLALLSYPRGTALALAASIAGAALLDGAPALAAIALAVALLFAYVLAGLAIAHSATRGFAWRPFALGGLYAAALTINPVLHFIALVGLADTIWPLRGKRDEG